jgi:hypothetical protein
MARLGVEGGVNVDEPRFFDGGILTEASVVELAFYESACNNRFKD